MSSDLRGLREQILSNAKLMLNYNVTAEMHHAASASTLVPGQHEAIEVVVFGEGSSFTGAVMLGLKPAIEGGEAANPEAAIRKLLLASAEALSLYIPKIGVHQRNIHGGGIFDEDLVIRELGGGGR